MKLSTYFIDFLETESGAASVEYKVLAAAGAFVFLGIITYVSFGVETLHEDTKYQVKKQEAVTSF